MRFLLFIFMAVSASATTYYVDNAAGGTNSGTISNPWQSIGAIAGLAAGDTVYISGGATSQTYNMSAYWNPTSGSAGNRITYQIDQRAGKNGTVIFNYTGGAADSNPWVSGTSYATFSGDAGDGLRHFKLTGYTVMNTNTTNQVRIAYIDASAGIGSGTGAATASQWASANGIEFDHNYLNDTALAADSVLTASFSGTVAADNKIHDNVFYAPYKNNGIGAAKLLGADFIHITGSTGFSVYRNTGTGVLNNSYSAGQHDDGIQMDMGSEFLIDSNIFHNIANYGIYGEAISGNFLNGVVSNNVIDNNDSEIASGSPGGVIFGVAGGNRSFTNIVIANNITVNLGSNQVSYALNNLTGFTGTFTGCVLSNNVSVDSGGVSVTGNSTTTPANNVAITTGAGATNFVSYIQYGGASNNYHLLPAASTLIGQGSDLSAYFTADADGLTRSTWDRGPLKYVSAAFTPAALFFRAAEVGTGF